MNDITFREELASLSLTDRMLWTFCRNVLVVAAFVGLVAIFMAMNGLAFPWAGAATQS